MLQYWVAPEAPGTLRYHRYLLSPAVSFAHSLFGLQSITIFFLLVLLVQFFYPPKNMTARKLKQHLHNCAYIDEWKTFSTRDDAINKKAAMITVQFCGRDGAR